MAQRMVPHFIWNEPIGVDELFELETSALAKDDLVYFPDRDGAISYGSEEETFEVTLTYSDMFGNSYESRYLDDKLAEYQWIRPAKLQFSSIPRPTTRLIRTRLKSAGSASQLKDDYAAVSAMRERSQG